MKGKLMRSVWATLSLKQWMQLLTTERSVNISVLLLARVFLKLESRFLSSWSSLWIRVMMISSVAFISSGRVVCISCLLPHEKLLKNLEV